jgi:hypothetical protein
MGAAVIGGIERRRTSRHAVAEEHGVVRVRVRPGHEASLLNLSSGGAVIDTAHRLLPGAPVELQLETPHRRIGARGRIVRCEVVSVAADRLLYRAAICFDAPLAPALSPGSE